MPGIPTVIGGGSGTASSSSSGGGLNALDSVRVATTTALPAYVAAGLTLTGAVNGAFADVDDITLLVNESILVKSEAGAARKDHGVYRLTTVGSAGTKFVLTRRADADADDEVISGTFVFVEEGTVNAGTGWIITTDDPIVVGTSLIIWAQFSAGGGGGGPTITAGIGLTDNASTFDVNVDGSTIEINADTLRVKALGITDAHVASGNKDGLPGTACMRTLGTGSAQAMAGDDARVSASTTTSSGIVELATQAEVNTGTDTGRVVTPETLAAATTVVHPARTVTAGNGLSGGGALSGDITLTLNVDDSTIEINADTARVKALGITDSHVAAANKDGTSGTPSMRTLGTTSSTAAAGNHQGNHIGGGTQEIDGDKLDIDWNPSNYTPATVAETSGVDDLSSHLKGIDVALGIDNVRILDFDFAEDPSNTQIQRKKAPNGWTVSSVVARASGIPTAGTIAVERDNDNSTQTQFTGATVNASTITPAHTETAVGTVNATPANRAMAATSWIKVSVVNLDLPASTDALNIAVILVRT